MRDGKKNRMIAEKMEALTSIGFSWAIPRGCSAKLRYIKMNEHRYKAEVARREGTEFDLNDVSIAVSFADPAFDLPQSFGRDINLSPKSTQTPLPRLVSDGPQSTREASLESKEMDSQSVGLTVADDCVSRHQSYQHLEFTQYHGGSDYLEGSPAVLPPLLGVTNTYPIDQAKTCYFNDVCARLQRSGNHINFTLGKYGDLHTYKIYPGVSEQVLQHGTSIDTNLRLALANTTMSQQKGDRLLQAKLVDSLQMEMLAQLRFDHAYIAQYAEADQLSSASKLLSSADGQSHRNFIKKN
jgi:hypothetical protein